MRVKFHIKDFSQSLFFFFFFLQITLIFRIGLGHQHRCLIGSKITKIASSLRCWLPELILLQKRNSVCAWIQLPNHYIISNSVAILSFPFQKRFWPVLSWLISAHLRLTVKNVNLTNANRKITV